MADSNLRSLCDLPVSRLYAYESSSLAEPVTFVLCSTLKSTCDERSCDCRNSTATSISGSTVYIPVCVADGAPCRGPEIIDCGSSSNSSSGGPAPPTADSSDTGLASTTNASSTELMSLTAAAASSTSSTGSSSTSASIDLDSTTAISSSSTNIPVMVGIILVSVVFVALVSWFVRSYCLKKHQEKNKVSGQNADSSVPSPSTSTAPSFPAFDRLTRSVSSGSRERYCAQTARGYAEVGMPYRANDARGYRKPETQRGGNAALGVDFQYGNQAARAYAGTRQEAIPSSSQADLSATSGQGPKMQYADWVASGQPIRQVFEDDHTSEEEETFDEDLMPIPLLQSSVLPRNGDSSVASFETTVEVPGRRRPTALQKRQPHQHVGEPRTSQQSEGSSEDSELNDSYASDASSDMMWASSSGLSDGSYYRRASTMSGSSMYRSTGASSSSLLSPSSNSTGSDSVYRYNHEFEI